MHAAMFMHAALSAGSQLMLLGFRWPGAAGLEGIRACCLPAPPRYCAHGSRPPHLRQVQHGAPWMMKPPWLTSPPARSPCWPHPTTTRERGFCSDGWAELGGAGPGSASAVHVGTCLLHVRCWAQLASLCCNGMEPWLRPTLTRRACSAQCRNTFDGPGAVKAIDAGEVSRGRRQPGIAEPQQDEPSQPALVAAALPIRSLDTHNWPLLARCVQMGSLTLLPGPPGLPISWARLEIGPCSMIVRILI